MNAVRFEQILRHPESDDMEIIDTPPILVNPRYVITALRGYSEHTSTLVLQNERLEVKGKLNEVWYRLNGMWR